MTTATDVRDRLEPARLRLLPEAAECADCVRVRRGYAAPRGDLGWRGALTRMPSACTCSLTHAPRLVVVTGGPGAGKTALLEVVQRDLCHHVVVLPEAASILWRGQFPRHPTIAGRKAAQRTIVRVQLEMQRMAIEEGRAALIVCDRGTLDGLAYWPGSEREYFDDIASTKQDELARYATVIHMRTPSFDHGYMLNQFRIESAAEAALIDAQIDAAWSSHPRRFVIDSDDDFVSKLHRALDLVRAEVPACCRPTPSS